MLWLDATFMAPVRSRYSDCGGLPKHASGLLGRQGWWDVREKVCRWPASGFAILLSTTMAARNITLGHFLCRLGRFSPADSGIPCRQERQIVRSASDLDGFLPGFGYSPSRMGFRGSPVRAEASLCWPAMRPERYSPRQRHGAQRSAGNPAVPIERSAGSMWEIRPVPDRCSGVVSPAQDVFAARVSLGDGATDTVIEALIQRFYDRFFHARVSFTDLVNGEWIGASTHRNDQPVL